MVQSWQVFLQLAPMNVLKKGHTPPSLNWKQSFIVSSHAPGILARFKSKRTSPG